MTSADTVEYVELTATGAPVNDVFGWPEYVGPTEGARFLGIHRDTLRRYGDAGVIPCVRTRTNARRFLRTDLARFLAASPF